MELVFKRNERIAPDKVKTLVKKLNKARNAQYTVVEISEGSGVPRPAIYNLIGGKRITKVNGDKLEKYLDEL